MSRFFEFLEKLNGPTAARAAVGGSPHDDSDKAGEARQILSVLRLPEQSSESLRSDEPAVDLSKVPVEQVQIEPSDRLAVHSEPLSPAADRFRLMRTRLKELRNGNKLKSILVTSALPQDGKSTIALNLATALAENGVRNVLLIDADLYRSSLSRQLGLTAQPGLAECLDSNVNPFSTMRRLEPLSWYFLPAGQARSNPAELLHADSAPALMRKLLPSFEWIVVDSPPVVPSDAISLAQLCDATLLVARASKTPQQAVEDTIAAIGKKRVIGIVLNAITQPGDSYAKYYGSYVNGTKRE